MKTNRFIRLIFTAVFLVFGVSGCGDSETDSASVEVARMETTSEIEALIDRVETSRDQQMRLDAISALMQLHAAESLEAMAVLDVACTDLDPEVRRAAIHAVAVIAFKNDLECPETLLDALHDEDENVRLTASSGMAFSRYPSGSFEKLLNAANDPSNGVRANLASTIADAVHDDISRSVAIEKLAQLSVDPDFGVRNNSVQGLIRLAARYDVTVTHLLRYSHISFDDFDGLPDKEVHSQFSTGSQQQLSAIANSKPLILIEAIEQSLATNDSNLRRNAVIEVERLSEESAFKSLCEESELPVLLTELASDQNEAVSSAAASALQTLRWK